MSQVDHSLARGAANYLDDAICNARTALMADQRADGHWCYELEADCTIPAEYILLMHFVDEIDLPLQAKLASYLRNRQTEAGGWPLYLGGEVDLSCSVKAYYALKLAGDDPGAPHMQHAREAILHRGGAARSNVFTRICLAQFEQLPWRGIPVMPVEIVLLPRWFFFHLDKVSYWSRTVIVPLTMLCSLRARARNPTRTGCPELFVRPPEQEQYFNVPSGRRPTPRARAYLYLDRLLRAVEPLIPSALRARSMETATRWCVERMNGDEGLGGIFPAMVNLYQALSVLGYEREHAVRRNARAAIDKLLVERSTDAYCQPCVSPVWDTALATHALIESGDADGAVDRALEWLADRQIEQGGDWQAVRPHAAPGGWAFQYRNDHYPDLDDTAVVAWAMHRHDARRYAGAISRAADWLRELQSRNGGFAAFDADNTCNHLNDIPFADHQALLDPPTADVSARVATLLATLNRQQDQPVLDRCSRYLDGEQEPDGPWFGRWGTNYVYGTWSVLVALAAEGVTNDDPRVQKAVRWLESVQGANGGWGEDNDSYDAEHPAPGHYDSNHGSTSFQTAWAVLALVASGNADCDAARRGVDYLISTQSQDGFWHDPWFTAPGFPRVFYLKYHGYSRYFPLWALACYRNAITTRA